MSHSIDPSQLERSKLFSFFKEKIKQIYRSPTETEVVDKYGLIIVGGQALSLWAREYLLDEMTGEEVELSHSDDLDFIGQSGAVEFCEERLSVTFKRATLDDQTPNLGLAELVWDDDRKLIVDILDSIAGVKTEDIYKYLESVFLDGIRVAVIDPVSCLESRLFNLYAPWCSSYRREFTRTKLAMRASFYYIQEMLDRDGYRQAAPLIKRIHDLALSGRGKDFYYDFGADLLEAVPIDTLLLPENFVKKSWPRIKQQVSDARLRKEVQYKRSGREPMGTKITQESKGQLSAGLFRSAPPKKLR